MIHGLDIAFHVSLVMGLLAQSKQLLRGEKRTKNKLRIKEKEKSYNNIPMPKTLLFS